MALKAPPAELWAHFGAQLRWFVPRANFVASAFPQATVTSWWRSPTDNARVGGAARSQHLLGFAGDYAHPLRKYGAHADMVEVARSVGLVAIDEGDHVHVQTFPAGVLPARIFPL